MRKNPSEPNRISRSEFLSRSGKALFLTSVGAPWLFGCEMRKRDAQDNRIVADAASVVRYLFSCRKPNGAFGPADQDYTDLAWNYPAVHALRIMSVQIPGAEDCIRNGSQASPRMNLTGIYQRVMLRSLLGFQQEPDLKKQWTLSYGTGASIHSEEAKAVFNDMESLWHLVSAIVTAGGRVANPDEVLRAVSDFQDQDGSIFGHVIDTALAVASLHQLGHAMPHRNTCIRWLRSCQDDDGGFRWSPDDASYSNKPDVWYTWSAVMALDVLRAQPGQPERALDWINSLQNADGGFGDRPGWRSRIESTFHALATLDIMLDNPEEGIRPKKLPVPEFSEWDMDAYRFFQAHHKSPPGGSEMVDLIHSMGYHLIGVKAQDFDVKALRAYVREQNYPLEILANPEVYEHNYMLRGTLVDHVSNFLVPPMMSGRESAKFNAALEAGTKGLSWESFTEKVILPMLELGTLFYPEWDHGKINAYRVYDDGLDGMPGYNAIHAAHRNGPDRIRLYPYRERWIGHHPFLADGDAHRPIETPREYNNLMTFRNVYLAKKPGLNDYLEASLNGRSVCVIRDPELPSGITFYGDNRAVNVLKQHQSQWKWWEENEANF